MLAMASAKATEKNSCVSDDTRTRDLLRKTQTVQSPLFARFGSFELDLQAGQLRKKNHRIRVQNQPFQILALLLDNAGGVVTQGQIQKDSGPTITVNQALTKLRKRRRSKEVSLDGAFEEDEDLLPREVADGAPNPEELHQLLWTKTLSVFLCAAKPTTSSSRIARHTSANGTRENEAKVGGSSG
jgi:hypothetical protein